MIQSSAAKRVVALNRDRPIVITEDANVMGVIRCMMYPKTPTHEF